MAIPFTQYLMPDGRPTKTEIDMPPEIEELAHRFIGAGGWFESEMLRDYKTVSLTACWRADDGPQDIAIRVVPNGPAVDDAIAGLVRDASEYAEKASAR